MKKVDEELEPIQFSHLAEKLIWHFQIGSNKMCNIDASD